jgi:hypothetical protein
MYNAPAPTSTRKVYRLTRSLRGYEQHKDFPASERGLGQVLKAWKRGGNHGSIKLVEASKAN